jgi:hypothetical protein
MADRLKKAGYPDSGLNVFVPPDHPKDGGLIATLHGTDPASKAILLLAQQAMARTSTKARWNSGPTIDTEGRRRCSAAGLSVLVEPWLLCLPVRPPLSSARTVCTESTIPLTGQDAGTA